MEFIIDNNVISKFIYGKNHDYQEVTLTIPDGIEIIKKGADDEVILRQYKTFVLPASIKTIEDGAMIQLRQLENIILKEGSKFHFINGCLYSPDKKNLITSVNKIDKVDVIEGCEKIYEGAFLFRKINSINMPNTIIDIGKRCFNFCLELNKIKLSEKLNEIPFGAFANCCKLEELFIPNSVKRIGDNAIPQSTKLIFYAGSIVENYAKNNSMLYTKLMY